MMAKKKLTKAGRVWLVYDPARAAAADFRSERDERGTGLPGAGPVVQGDGRVAVGGEAGNGRAKPLGIALPQATSSRTLAVQECPQSVDNSEVAWAVGNRGPISGGRRAVPACSFCGSRR